MKSPNNIAITDTCPRTNCGILSRSRIFQQRVFIFFREKRGKHRDSKFHIFRIQK
jgi:hypothetical protein